MKGGKTRGPKPTPGQERTSFCSHLSSGLLLSSVQIQRHVPAHHLSKMVDKLTACFTVDIPIAPVGGSSGCLKDVGVRF